MPNCFAKTKSKDNPQDLDTNDTHGSANDYVEIPYYPIIHFVITTLKWDRLQSRFMAKKVLTIPCSCTSWSRLERWRSCRLMVQTVGLPRDSSWACSRLRELSGHWRSWWTPMLPWSRRNHWRHNISATGEKTGEKIGRKEQKCAVRSPYLSHHEIEWQGDSVTTFLRGVELAQVVHEEVSRMLLCMTLVDSSKDDGCDLEESDDDDEDSVGCEKDPRLFDGSAVAKETDDENKGSGSNQYVSTLLYHRGFSQLLQYLFFRLNVQGGDRNRSERRYKKVSRSQKLLVSQRQQIPKPIRRYMSQFHILPQQYPLLHSQPVQMIKYLVLFPHKK